MSLNHDNTAAERLQLGCDLLSRYQFGDDTGGFALPFDILQSR